MKLTKREKQLLDEAVKVMHLNKKRKFGDCYLTGSLALKLMGYDVIHECDDIDIVYPYSQDAFSPFYNNNVKEIVGVLFEDIAIDFELDELFFTFVSKDDYPDSTNALSSFAFKYANYTYEDNINLHLIVDFFVPSPNVNVIEYNGAKIPCANVEDIIRAKVKHSINGGKEKHVGQIKSLLEQGLKPPTEERCKLKY